MNDNCFIDTNILVYCYTDEEPIKLQKALDIANGFDTFISTQVLTELSNTLKRKLCNSCIFVYSQNYKAQQAYTS